MSTFAEARTLNEYPQGAHRWALLLLTVLAAVLASYEFQLAPLLPLLLPYIHMSTIFYAYFVTFTVLLSAISAFFGGPLADRYGRVVIIDACLGTVPVLVFLNLFIYNAATFIVIRTSMGLVGGLMAGAGAGLVRDMSPRINRALAFGLLTIGPVGANFLATFIAGKTLPIFHTWQSQIWIMGILGIVMYLPIFFFLKDLSPALRLSIFKSEMAAAQAQGRRMPSAADLPSGTRDAFARLLRHREVWLLVFGMVPSLTLYFTIQPFGPLMFTQAFHYSPADANAMNAYFWAGNMVALVIVGVISDRLQMRKPIAIFGAILSAIVVAYWVSTFGREIPRSQMAVIASVLGVVLAIAYVPWSAQFSETLEDVSAALQATGWAFYGLVARGWVAIAAPLAVIVARSSGWGVWVEVSLVGMAIYIAAMFFTRPQSAPVPTASREPSPEIAHA